MQSIFVTTVDRCQRRKVLKVLKPTRKTIRDTNGNPATITRVELWREFSKHVCQLGVNFFSRGAVFVVRGGCKGIFKICYAQTPTTQAPLTTAAPCKSRFSIFFFDGHLASSLPLILLVKVSSRVMANVDYSQYRVHSTAVKPCTVITLWYTFALKSLSSDKSSV